MSVGIFVRNDLENFTFQYLRWTNPVRICAQSIDNTETHLFFVFFTNLLNYYTGKSKQITRHDQTVTLRVSAI